MQCLCRSGLLQVHQIGAIQWHGQEAPIHLVQRLHGHAFVETVGMDPAGQRLDEHHVQRRVVEGVPDAMGVAVADGGQCGKAVAVNDPLQAAAGIGLADAGPDGEPLAGALARYSDRKSVV